MPNIEWLLREATDERALMVDEKRTVLDDETWRATIERVEIGAGLRIFLSDAMARRDITVEPLNARTDPWVAGQITVSGRADIDFLDGQRAPASADHALMFRPVGRTAAYCLKAGTHFVSAGYGLDVTRIVRLFDGDVPSALRPLLEPDLASSRFVGMRSGRHLRSLADSLFARGLNGPLRLLMMEGAVVQLLALQAAAASRVRIPPPSRIFSPREREALHAARAQLVADMRKPPSLGALAAAVELSEKRLNAGFRALFGATVFETLRNERLEHARLALQAGTLSIKEVAHRVGYDHVTNFVSAFSARFGAPPRHYLRQRRSLRVRDS